MAKIFRRYRKYISISLIVALVACIVTHVALCDDQCRNGGGGGGGGGGLCLINPYTDVSHRYTVGEHGHTTKSAEYMVSQGYSGAGCGVDTPTQFMTAYKNYGYDAFAVTDYNSITPDPNVSGILYINGFEEVRKLPNYPHMTGIFVESDLLGGGLIDNTPLQDSIDGINDAGGLAIAAHHWVDNRIWTVEMLESMIGLTGIEIANESTVDKTGEMKWDSVLSDGYKLWGFGVDDAHAIAGWSNYYKLEVMANSLTLSNLKSAIKNGNFYVRQTGAPQLTITTSGLTITALSSASCLIEFIGKNGTIYKSTTNTSASYTVVGSEKYIRIRLIKDGKKTWSQPIFLSE